VQAEKDAQKRRHFRCGNYASINRVYAIYDLARHTPLTENEKVRTGNSGTDLQSPLASIAASRARRAHAA
jgi:hypothetical protein